MKANEFISNKPLHYITLLSEYEVIDYMKQRDNMLLTYLNITHNYNRNWRRASSTAFQLYESSLPVIQNEFLQKFNSYDQYNNLTVKVGSKIAIINVEISGERFDLWGFTNPQTITKIYYTDDEDKIMQFEFNNDPSDVWPRIDNAVYVFNSKHISHSIFFGDKANADQAILALLLSSPDEVEIANHIIY
jgi:hypothetical protein